MLEMLPMLLNSKAGAAAAAGIFGPDQSGPTTVTSGQSPIDGRGWLDGSGWTVSTGSSKANGATIQKADPVLAGNAGAPMQAGGLMVALLGLVAAGAVIYKARG